MEEKEKLEALLREYGYSNEAIQRYVKGNTDITYEEVKKRILPYHDITANPR